MASSFKPTGTQFALLICFLGSIVLGVGWLQDRNQRNVLREQNLTLAADVSEFRKELIATQNQFNEHKDSTAKRIQDLVSEGNSLADRDKQRRAMTADIVELRKAIVSVQEEADESKALLLKESDEARRRNVALLEAFKKLAVRLNAAKVNEPEEDNKEPAAKTLTVTIVPAGNGEVASLTVGLAKLFDGPIDARKLQLLDKRLKDVFAIEGTFDQVLLRVGKNLDFSELMKIIEVCTRQKMADGNPVNKLSFVELGEW
jgi:hypothetical protein